jgi:hypothetical protein
MTVLSFLKHKPKPVAVRDAHDGRPAKRNRQQNIEVSEDCMKAFAVVAEAEGLSKAALFEDMIAERLQALRL